MHREGSALRKRQLAAVISSLLAPAASLVPAAGMAQTDATETIIVTATRRANTVQDVPINITAIGGATIEERRLDGLQEISRYVPGLAVSELGPRDEFPNLIVRGLNTNSVGPLFPRSVTVATYLGEIPMQADFATSDLERVEVLIGPQGTLYGSGTLGGTVRYIPNRPDPEGFDAQLRGRAYDIDQGSTGQDLGFTVNVPLVDDALAIRASVDYLDDPGYIDYGYIVREAGVSNPQPDFSDPDEVAANLRRVEDADFQERLTGRIALRWLPTENIDATLSYHYQDVDAGGRTLASVESIGSGRYEAGYRFEEPTNNRNELLSLEIIADLGFAELTSATGSTSYRQHGQRDQTDLLLNFEVGYETFPSFSAYTSDDDNEDSLVQEFRLVSNGTGPFSWIGGLFYSDFEGSQSSREYVPHFDEWAVDELDGLALRPDALEYIEVVDEELTESALYGEISYETGSWLFTVGARAYDFEASSFGGFALPLADTVYGGAPADEINLEVDGNETDDSGTLFKFNLSRYFGSNILGYVTISEGYRIGGVNPVHSCTPDELANPGESVCALPDEVLFEPDTTTNYEVGVHSTLAEGRLTLNAAVYQIDWEDIQVGDVTMNGAYPITSNGSEAKSEGVEIGANLRVGDRWQLFGTYAYTNAELTEGTDALLGDGLTDPLFTPAGSRLPGSPEQQGSVGLTWSTDFDGGYGFDIGYNISYMGSILTSIGAGEVPSVEPWRGEELPSYQVHQFTATLSRNQWSASFFIDNVLDEYYFTSVRESQRMIEPYRDYLNSPFNFNGFVLRSYARYIGAPRKVGLGFTYNF
jgi:outer membrane receptor protein involved in Fe transport